MGITGLLGYLTLPRHIVFQHGGVLVGALLVLAVTGLDGSVSRIEGATLVAIYLIYFIYLLREPWRNGHPLQHDADRPAYMLWLYLLAGLIVVVGSAELTVRTVIAVAQILNIEQSFIAVIVIGIGTSLPELSISVVAVMKKRHGLSVGNLVGSNIFDTLVPIGVAAAISTLRFNKELLQYDLTLLVALTLLVLFFFSRRKGLHKPQALVILVFYCSYALVRIGNAQIE
jgi:cation:H+ antiporter